MISFLRKLLLILLLYIFIYNPVFVQLGFGLVLVLIGIAALYLLLHGRKLASYLHYYRQEFILSILITIYVSAVCVLNGTEQIGRDMLIWILTTVIVPIFLVESIFHQYLNDNFYNYIISVGFIASLISCFALFNPSFNAFLRNIQDAREYSKFALAQFEFRYFGLATNLSSGYGYVQGIIASLCILRLDKNHKRYILYFVPIVISVLINARTGVFPVFITIAYIIIRSLSKFDIKKILKIGLGIAVGLCALLYMLRLNPDIYEFVMDFFDQLDEMFFSKSGLKDSAYVTMIRFPESIGGLLFGEGRSLYGVGNAEGSDIAYINQIFIGGILFLSLLLFYEFIVYYNIRHRSREKVFSTIFFISILIFNYKGVNFYTSSAFMKLWMLYYFVLVHNIFHPSKLIDVRMHSNDDKKSK